jgi:hypothetical protein
MLVSTTINNKEILKIKTDWLRFLKYKIQELTNKIYKKQIYIQKLQKLIDNISNSDEYQRLENFLNQKIKNEIVD